MIARSLLCLWLAVSVIFPAHAQDYELDLEAVITAVADWAEENLDPEFLNALGEPDREKIEQLLQALQNGLAGTNVQNLATLRPLATNLMTILSARETTQPYAAWLASRIEYLEVAEEIQRRPPPKAVVTNVASPPKSVASAALTDQRAIWVQKLNNKPLPKGAEALVSRIKPIFAEEKVTPELVWIAEVESSFDPRARSPVGAAGLFQFMPATAREYGLRTWPWDQRYQPDASARAAAQYLRVLHRRFGDWPLALAAYNAGQGRVANLLKEHRATRFEQIAPYLPAETQLYVPKVEAAILRREGVQLANLPPPR